MILIMNLQKQKWNVKSFDKTLIARLLSELEGSCYILDCLNEEDFKTIDNLRKKYYKVYFQLK
jgi:hypothetical protein